MSIKEQRKVNPVKLIDNTAIVYFYNSSLHFLCDLEDWERLKQYCWHYSKDGYAVSNLGNATYPHNMYFHRVIITPPDGLFIDHINRDRLDDRKQNLRIVNKLQNNLNKSNRSDNTTGVMGVSWDKERNKWRAMICFHGKSIHIGMYDNFDEAVIARKAAEKVLFAPILKGCG